MKRPLDLLFSPGSVAVVGASRRRDSIGFALLRNLLASEFQGAIYPVNPRTQFVHSLKCYPSVSAIPDPVDLAVIAVPRDQVLATARECVANQVGALVVISAGFAETGAAGAALEVELRELVRAAGVRMIGPNCMGIINTDPAVALNATFAPVPARAGSIGFVSQSGALGVAILNMARELGIGLTQFVSMGNKADVSGNDLLEHWEPDPATRVICMYLESFGNPRRFTEIAKRVGRQKPILVVKSGRSAAGARAATSHTGAIGGADVTASAFLEQCGVLRANTIEELFDVARALDRCPLPTGKRVGIVTNAGGPAIMATDACIDHQLEMAELSAETRAELASFLPAGASTANPVDMIASADGGHYRRSIARVLADPGVDMAIVINVTPLLANPIDILEAVGVACAGQPKPVLAVVMANEEFHEEARRRPGLPPVFRFPESAARALAMLHRYGEWRRRPAAEVIPEFTVDDAAVAALLEAAGSGYLEPAAALRVLELYGIPTVRWRWARTRAEALAAASELGYPLALKAIAPDLVHKTEAGAVRLDLEDEAALRQGLESVSRGVEAAGLQVSGYLLQEMARGGHETIFGVTTDAQFGPLLMFGLGGIYVEVLKDVRFGVLPLTAADASAMVRGIRAFPLLAGVRGERPADLALLEEVLLRLAQLVARHPEIRELDINPFLAAPVAARGRALDARIRVERS